MNKEKIQLLQQEILTELFLGIQEMLTDNLSIRITLGKASNNLLTCELYNSNIEAIKDPWLDYDVETGENYGQEKINLIKSKIINFNTKQKLSPEENNIKKEILENYDLILNIMSEYDDVLISSTIINYERVSGFENVKPKKKIKRNK